MLISSVYSSLSIFRLPNNICNEANLSDMEMPHLNRHFSPLDIALIKIAQRDPVRVTRYIAVVPFNRLWRLILCIYSILVESMFDFYWS